MFYIPSALELTISEYLFTKGIINLADLTPHKVCDLFNVNLIYYFGPSEISEISGNASIMIDKQLTIPEQRYNLYHYIAQITYLKKGHVPLKLPPSPNNNRSVIHDFIEYLAIPHHLLMRINLSDSNIIHTLSKEFCVPEFISENRLKYMRRMAVV